MKLFLLLGFVLMLNSCEKEVDLQTSGKSIDIYLISEYQRIDNTFKIIDSTVVLSTTKIIDYSNIISYSSKDYIFTVSDSVSVEYKVIGVNENCTSYLDCEIIEINKAE